ncbi:MAG TPA: hypothetical protein VLH56_18960 [Dissulfurispiraceae bacterium]|nr:hypothetical protein [Dissulfurispiraceae bacterium]
MGEVVIIRLPHEQIDGLWSLLSPQINSALRYAHGELALEDIRSMAKDGQVQIWTIQDAESKQLYGTAVTQVVVYPGLRSLRIITLGGRALEVWARALSTALETFAREQKARRLEAYGRKGLQKMLEVLAFKPAYVALIKEVET